MMRIARILIPKRSKIWVESTLVRNTYNRDWSPLQAGNPYGIVTGDYYITKTLKGYAKKEDLDKVFSKDEVSLLGDPLSIWIEYDYLQPTSPEVELWRSFAWNNLQNTPSRDVREYLPVYCGGISLCHSPYLQDIKPGNAHMFRINAYDGIFIDQETCAKMRLPLGSAGWYFLTTAHFSVKHGLISRIVRGNSRLFCQAYRDEQGIEFYPPPFLSSEYY